MKKSNDITGNRTRDLPACSIVPQPTTLPRAETNWFTLLVHSLFKEMKPQENIIFYVRLYIYIYFFSVALQPPWALASAF
jgi:hypothetical protein